MDSKLSRWCDAVIEIGCLAALLTAPLFFNIHSDRVFEPDKLTLIRSLALFLSTVWLVKFIDQEQWRRWDWARWSNPRAIWHTPFVLPVVALVVVYLLATFFSVTPRVSWAGSYQRLQGTYTTLSYIVIFALAVQTFRTAAQMQRAVTAVIIATIPVALYGMLQRFGLDPLPWGGDVQTRIAGHMGNAIFIAAYLIMGVPLTLGRIINAFSHILTDEELNPADIIRSSIYIFVFAIQLIAIWWSGSRGPQLGLGVGLFAFVLIFLVALRNSVQGKEGYSGRDLAFSAIGTLLPLASFGAAVALRPSVGDGTSVAVFGAGVALTVLLLFILVAVRRGWLWLWLSWIQVVLVMGAFLLAFNFVPPAAESSATDAITATFDAWRGVSGVGRLGRMLEADDGTGRVRVLIWEGAVKLVLPHPPLAFPDGSTDRWNFLRPLIGYGPEAMYVAYNSFYPPELASLEARNASPDRSHNETWDALVITGLLGFLAWQWLYVTMFYYGFRWLGVAQTKLDRNLLVGLWVGVGTAVAIAFALWRGPAYIGVSWPLGNIIGVIVYLIYYAITAKPSVGELKDNPFSADRLLLIALLGGMIAHYVEIHFGIAIAVTRVHFFMFAALMLVLGTQQAGEELTAEPEPAAKRRGTAVSGRAIATGWGAPAAMWSFLLALIIALLAFSFTNYAPPPGKVIQSMADLPTAGDIFMQSFFVNSAQQFSESPFLFLVLVMAWLLGSLLALSEMVRGGLITLLPPAPPRKEGVVPPLTTYQQVASALLAAGGLMALALLLMGLFGDTSGWGTTRRIGHLTLAPLVLLLCGQGLVPLVRRRPQGGMAGAAVAAAFLVLSIPVLIAGGGWYGLFMLVASSFVLYLLWDTAVSHIVTPALTISLTSLAGGLIFALIHANQLRGGMITPTNVGPNTPETVRRVAEAVQYAGILTPIYLFIFTFVLVTAVFMVLPRPTKNTGTTAGWVALPILLLAGLIGLRATNLQVVQADIIYKRGKPFDAQAPSVAAQNREQGVQLWDNAIAIYEKALSLAPNEDFYYLWLGRAYLEKATLVSGNPVERDRILSTAEESLFVAQNINPLNTDHTANLARLNTRWAGLIGTSDPAEQAAKVERAQAFYRAAISLSPQNAVIRNEYGRMTYSFSQSCAQAMPIYSASQAADPFYAQTPLEMAEIQIACAANAADEAERASYYDSIMTNLQEGLRIATEITMKDRPPIGRAWAQAGQAFAEWQQWDKAIVVYEVLLTRSDNPIPVWQTHIQIASAYNGQGETALALAQANLAKEEAPPEVLAQIEAFIATIGQ